MTKHQHELDIIQVSCHGVEDLYYGSNHQRNSSFSKKAHECFNLNHLV